MSKTRRDEYEAYRQKITDADYTDHEKTHFLELLDAYDGERRTPVPAGESPRSYGTLRAWAGTYHRLAQHARTLEHPTPLTQMTPEQVNDMMEAYDVANSTKKNYQGHLRILYRYHDDLGIDDEAIWLANARTHNPVDERDMYTSDEIHALRANAINDRDRALLDLLIYTGQRISAIQSLRVKDIDLDAGATGVLYLNDTGGELGNELKGADGKRPLLGAKKAVRQWLNHHPTKQPEDALITHTYEWTGHSEVRVGDPLHHSTLNDALKRIGKRAGVTKPVNAHNFRHYFATICIRDYNMDPDTVKHLMGHAPTSRVFEETYKHLTDDDYIKKAEEARGDRTKEKESPLTPPVCETCAEPLEPNWQLCPACGAIYGPSAERVKDEVDKAMGESALQTSPDAPEADALQNLMAQVRDDPEQAAQLMSAALEAMNRADDADDEPAAPAAADD